MLTRLFDALYTWRLRKSVRPVGGSTPQRIACWDCATGHQLPGDLRQALASAEDFAARHAGHQVNWQEQPGYAGLWHSNADCKASWQSVQTLTTTSLQSLASSATAGWQSAVVDNTANLYLDAQVLSVLDFANTAPANSKAVFWYSYGGLESGTYTYPCSGSEGALTLSDVTANPTALRRIGTTPYLVQDAVIPAGPFSLALAWGGILPRYWGVAAINHSGAALASSGNVVKAAGVFYTII